MAVYTGPLRRGGMGAARSRPEDDELTPTSAICALAPISTSGPASIPEEPTWVITARLFPIGRAVPLFVTTAGFGT